MVDLRFLDNTLTVVKIPSISQIMDGFVKVDFLNKNRLNRFSPPSWIFFQQTQRIFVDASATNKTHKRFLKSVENWSFDSKIKFFCVLGAILDFAAILHF
jgi:hypothetical protein